jgi:hypothetical protein
LVNIGGIGGGARYRKSRLGFVMAILNFLLREGLEDWVDSPTGFEVFGAIRYTDDVYLHPEELYSRIEFAEK